MKSQVPRPEISAKSYIVMDVERNKILASLNHLNRLAPASTTKLMTALVAYELYPGNAIVRIPETCAGVDGARAGFMPAEIINISDLMHSLLISSSNDAACALAKGIIPESEFIGLMNAKAFEIGLQNTHFTNAIGFDDAVGEHYSSSYDLYLLGKKLQENGHFSDIVKMKEYSLTSGNMARRVYTTNYLLWAVPESVGIKTGTTTEAGEVLVYEYKDNEKDLIIVVMGSTDRFTDTRRLLDWVLTSYSWK
jgi:D-alanyl-D-alanine carboxypeptidase (penicillin-binding protein 5/6)